MAHGMDSMPMNMTDTGSSNSTSMDSGMHMDSMGHMKTYLHFTGGDTLIFAGIAPSSPGAIFGASLVFFLIAVGERWLRAATRGVERRFAQRTQRLLVSYAPFDGTHGQPATKDGVPPAPAPTRFILSHEISRGVLAGLQTTIHYLLMLVVMTFNAALIISVILGVVVGEVAFGRLHNH